MFINAIKNELNDSVTENGAHGYRTTGKALLDLNFAVASLRSATDADIVNRFKAACEEDAIHAIKWLFFARDVRGGLGERRLFRVAMNNLAKSNSELVANLIPLIPEFGRFDDLYCLLDGALAEKVIGFIGDQLVEDIRNAHMGKPISLLAKWLPSANASSQRTKEYARKIYRGLGMTECHYRKTLSELRKKLDVVECKMSNKEWGAIRYEGIPSRANLIYNNAFLRNDEARRREYLARLERGEAKINSSVLFPHEILRRYGINRYYRAVVKPELEAMWKALPNLVNGNENTIVVADGSGSMGVRIDPPNMTTALDVANALAIYFAERASGEFKNKYITFSECPQLVELPETSLKDKILTALRHTECANTNIKAVFDLILNTAVNNHMPQEEVPSNILIISDMEFDQATRGFSGWGRHVQFEAPSKKLFTVIKEQYKAAGYKLPRLVFWNVNSRTGTIPVKENELGVALVSGFSVNVCKMVLSGKLDPYECLLETINSERYQAVEDAVRKAI